MRTLSLRNPAFFFFYMDFCVTTSLHSLNVFAGVSAIGAQAKRQNVSS